MKSFKSYIAELRGGTHVVVNSETGKITTRTNKKGEEPAIFGTERDAWDHADRLSSYGKHKYTVKTRKEVGL